MRFPCHEAMMKFGCRVLRMVSAFFEIVSVGFTYVFVVDTVVTSIVSIALTNGAHTCARRLFSVQPSFFVHHAHRPVAESDAFMKCFRVVSESPDEFPLFPNTFPCSSLPNQQ